MQSECEDGTVRQVPSSRLLGEMSEVVWPGGEDHTICCHVEPCRGQIDEKTGVRGESPIVGRRRLKDPGPGGETVAVQLEREIFPSMDLGLLQRVEHTGRAETERVSQVSVVEERPLAAIKAANFRVDVF